MMAESPDESKSSGRFQDAGRRLDERVESAIPRVEEEIRRLISYLNDEVVPNLRQDSAKVLRSAADQLRKFASHLDDNWRTPE
jgi:bisphosphoglycerate-dependent phosphoglycerate mutase